MAEGLHCYLCLAHEIPTMFSTHKRSDFIIKRLVAKLGINIIANDLGKKIAY